MKVNFTTTQKVILNTKLESELNRGRSIVLWLRGMQKKRKSSNHHLFFYNYLVGEILSQIYSIIYCVYYIWEYSRFKYKKIIIFIVLA